MSVDDSDGPPPGSGGPMLTRRAALKTGAVGAASVATLGVSQSGVEVGPLDIQSPVGEADALVPALLGAAAVGAGVGWALREAEILGSDDVPDGLGPDALHQQIYQTAKKRKSVNQSTIVDNENIIKYMPEGTFSHAKVKMLEHLDQADPTKEELIDIGQSEAGKHMATIEENVLTSWNESLAELENLQSAVEQSSNLSGVIEVLNKSNGTSMSVETTTRDITLRDGSSISVKRYDTVDGFADLAKLDGPPYPYVKIINPDGDNIRYLYVGDAEGYDEDTASWRYLWNSMQSTFDDVMTNIATWVDNSYEEIQSGEGDPTDYMSATDLSNTIAQDADGAQAIADMVALNIPGDYGNQLTIELGDGTRLQGYLASTDPGDREQIEPGQTIDPNATDADGNPVYGTWYLITRPSSYIETWDHVDESYGIQSGQLRFTQDPTVSQDGLSFGDSIEYVIETNKGETARVTPSEFSEESIDGTTYWQVDVSDQLSETIAEINRVRRVYNGENPDEYRTMMIDQQFTVVESESGGPVEIQQNREPQTDSNYISEEEWQQFKEQRQELIDRFEEASNSGGLIDVGNLDLPSLPGWIPGSGLVQYAVVGVGGLIGINALTN